MFGASESMHWILLHEWSTCPDLAKKLLLITIYECQSDNQIWLYNQVKFTKANAKTRVQQVYFSDIISYV